MSSKSTLSIFFFLILLSRSFSQSPGNTTADASSTRQFVGYVRSWADLQPFTADSIGFANLPKYVTTIILSFVQPDNTYQGDSLNVTAAGFNFSETGDMIKEAISIAKSAGSKVMVSVGGYNYTNWAGLNTDGIAAVVKDFGFDGVDIFYIPKDYNYSCTSDGRTVSCGTDQEFQDVVNKLRQAVPSPSLLSIASFNIGAFGEGDYAFPDINSSIKGISVNLLKSDAGKSLDQVNLRAFDAGANYDPFKAFQAVKSYFSGKVTFGVEVPPELWGGHTTSVDEVKGIADWVNQNGGDGDGMMLWAVDKIPEGNVSATNPGPTEIGQTICTEFGLEDCDSPITIPGLSSNFS